MSPRLVTEVYKPSHPHHKVDNLPIQPDHYGWGYRIGEERRAGGGNVPNDGSTAIFRILPGGMTEPVLVNRPGPAAKYSVEVITGKGRVITASKDDEVKVTPVKAGDNFEIYDSEAYSYVNIGKRHDLILREVATPAFKDWDEIKLTGSLMTEASLPTGESAYAVTPDLSGRSVALALPSEFYRQVGEAAAGRIK